MPDWNGEIRKRLTSLKLAPAREVEIIEELSQHLDERYADLRMSGATDEAALRTTLAELNGSEVLARELRRVERFVKHETVLGARRLNMLGDVLQDMRFALRMLRRSPGFTAVAVLTLALGIGANTAIFSVVDAVLLRRLAYHKADELVMFHFENERSEEVWYLSPPAFFELRAQNTAFADVAAWGNNTWPANLIGGGEPERLQGFEVSANFFDVLGTPALEGRTFLSDEGVAGNNRVVVISHDFWQRRFGCAPEIIGSSILLNGAPYDIVGVMPADFRFVLKTDVWTPLALDASQVTDRNRADLHFVARLKPGVSTELARAEAESVLRPYLKNQDAEWSGLLKPLQTVLMDEVSHMLVILFGAVGFVLLIACANIANLLLARASARTRELAIRAALGANPLRVVRQLLVESAMLAAFGGAAALLLASWCTKFLVSGLPESVAAKNSHVAMLKLDAWALGFAAALSMLTTLIFGLVPAIQSSKLNLLYALKDGGGSEPRVRGQNRLRSALAVTEIAMATVLLTGAALMIKSLWQLNKISRGFESAGVLTANIDLAGVKYREPEQVVRFYSQLLVRISAIPGVERAGITNGFLDRGWRVAIAEQSPVPDHERPVASRHPASEDYFSAMGIPLRAGRLFTDRDVKGAQPVVIIDEALARRHFPDENPLGKHLRFEDTLREIVGVVGATRAWKRFTLGDVDAPRVYLPYQQESPLPTMALIVRGRSGNAASLIPGIKRELAAIDKDQPIHSFRLLEESVRDLEAPQQFPVLLLGAFAAVAVMLAAVGVYGVMSYSVAQRTHEIGVRRALGAQTRQIRALVLKRGLGLVIVGVLIGLACAYAMTRVLRGALFGVSETDPMTFAVVSLMLAGVALAACYLPARRASQVDPTIALRHE